MKAGPPNDSPQDTRWDENDPLWDLLGRAPRPEPDGWFAARALARCRHERPGGDAVVAGYGRFAQVWRWALGGGLAVAMAVAFVVTQINPPEKVDNQKNVQEAFEIVASIDTDSDSSSSPWQDSSL
jgi:hypothetical protein